MIRNMCCFILFEFYLFLLVLLLLAKERKRSDASWRVAKYGDHTLNFCSAFNPSKWTNTHTHHEHKPGAVGSHLCSGTRWAFGGSVPCSRVSSQSWYWGWIERWTFAPSTYNPCRTWDLNPQPLGYKSDSLSIRPRPPCHLGAQMKVTHNCQVQKNRRWWTEQLNARLLSDCLESSHWPAHTTSLPHIISALH